MYVLAVASAYLGKIDIACRYFTNIVNEYSDDYIDKQDIFRLLRMCQAIPRS
jgi:TolA-binding protein